VVTGVYAKMGGYVSKGQTLFTIDSSQLTSTLEQASISVETALTNLERMTTLYDEGAIPLQTYEQAQTAYDVAVQNLNAAQTTLIDYSVEAPISGYVTSVNVAAGSIASQAVASLTISNTSSLEITANVAETLINKIHRGDTVNVLIKSFSEDPLPGTVTAVAPAPLPSTLTYPIKITLENKDDALKPGMFAEITIEADRAESVLSVPSKAVIIRAGRQIVMTLDSNDAVVINEVETGINDGELIEIKQGISEGDKVVVEGQTYLDESSTVIIME